MSRYKEIIRDIKLSETLDVDINTRYAPLIKYLNETLSNLKKFKFKGFDDSIFYENTEYILFEVYKRNSYTILFINDSILFTNLITFINDDDESLLNLVKHFISNIINDSIDETSLFPSKNWTPENIIGNEDIKVYE